MATQWQSLAEFDINSRMAEKSDDKRREKMRGAAQGSKRSKTAAKISGDKTIVKAADPTWTIRQKTKYITPERVRQTAAIAAAREEFAKGRGISLRSKSETPTSEGKIAKSSPPLPAQPPELYATGMGRPSSSSANQLITFLRRVYGPYLPAHKLVLRKYIFRHDPKLYRAIGNYEQRQALPRDLDMPSERKVVDMLLTKAFKQAGFRGFSHAEKRKVVRKVVRDSRGKKNLSPR